MAIHLRGAAIAVTVLVTSIALSLLMDSRAGSLIWTLFKFYIPLGNWRISQTTTTLEVKPADVESMRISSSTAIKPTSVWCSGSSGGSRQTSHCRFESLCLRLESNEFIFIFDANRSTFYPTNLRYATSRNEFGRLSPVADHNLYGVDHLVTVAHSQMDSLGRQLYYLPGKTLLMSRFKPDNLMHLIHDDLLPLFATFRQLGLDLLRDTVFVNDKWNLTVGLPLFQAFFANILHKDRFLPDSIVCFENAYIGLTNSTIWYQYGFMQPQSAVPRTFDEKVYIRQTIRFFRDRLVVALNLDDTCQFKHSLLFVRSSNRRILNAGDFFQFLQQHHFSDLRLFILNPLDMGDVSKIRDLLQSILCAHTLIGMHGSEHIMSLLMTPNVQDDLPISVIELFPYGIESNDYTPFKTLAHILGHRYYVWTNSIKENAVFHGDDYPPEWGGLSHLDSAERQLIQQNAIDQPLEPFLCCDNPSWLYRIYQDTIVDIGLFDNFLRSNLKENFESSYQNIQKPDIFHLSEVSNISCLSFQAMVNISWSPPWNFDHLPVSESIGLKYEVLLQALNTKEASRWESDQEHISVSEAHCPLMVGCNVWVRPFLHKSTINSQLEVIGFYSRGPFVCMF